ncbi:MAG: hypothetical protein JKY96_09120 [Phycisphaerales bacterium]|nr:hypothetical protein [Phycisphaerales bacterium]
MGDIQNKAIALVGHCGPDAFALQSAVRGFIRGAEVHRVNDQTKLHEMMPGLSLLLVNRVLDGEFEVESGIEFIRGLGDDAPPAMLISNFADHLQASIEAGAQPGFGKQNMRSPEAEIALNNALAIGAENG